MDFKYIFYLFNNIWSQSSIKPKSHVKTFSQIRKKYFIDKKKSKKTEKKPKEEETTIDDV